MKKTLAIKVLCLLATPLFVPNSDVVLQAAFGVLGVVYSISTSTALSISLIEVKNNEKRNKYKRGLTSVVKSLTWDFLLSTLLITLGLIFSSPIKIPNIPNITINIPSIGIFAALTSIWNEAYTFVSLTKFKQELYEILIEENSKG